MKQLELFPAPRVRTNFDVEDKERTGIITGKDGEYYYVTLDYNGVEWVLYSREFTVINPNEEVS